MRFLIIRTRTYILRTNFLLYFDFRRPKAIVSNRLYVFLFSFFFTKNRVRVVYICSHIGVRVYSSIIYNISNLKWKKKYIVHIYCCNVYIVYVSYIHTLLSFFCLMCGISIGIPQRNHYTAQRTSGMETNVL